jgi:formate dehydrogenase subunit gamma
MSLYQTLSILAIAGTAGVCALHYLAVGRRRPRPGLGRPAILRYNLWERFLHLVLLATFLVLAVTAYWASIGWGGPMTGYSLMIHTTCGAVFAVAVAAMLITWAVGNAFGKHDCRWVEKGGPWSTRDDLPAGRFDAGDKIFFWAAGVLTLILLLSMLLSMVPLFGTAGQHLMYDIHRYAALVLMVLTLWHAYITTLAKPGGLTAVLRGRVTSGWARLYHPLWGGASEETGEAAEESDSEETPAD